MLAILNFEIENSTTLSNLKIELKIYSRLCSLYEFYKSIAGPQSIDYLVEPIVENYRKGSNSTKMLSCQYVTKVLKVNH